MFVDWVGTPWAEVGLVVFSAAVMVVAVIVITRIVGLRTFAKMSSFDFAVTVAIGSVIASTVVTSTPLANGVVAIGALLLVQSSIALVRRRSAAETVIDNTPLLLMRDGELIEAALTRARVSDADVRAKLREANVLRLDDVRAVILETTGDISVLHGSDSIDDELLDGVRQLD